MSKFTIKPARAGIIVRDPTTMRPLKDDGETKTISSYWLRRIADGDVVEVTPPAPSAPAPAPSASSSSTTTPSTTK